MFSTTENMGAFAHPNTSARTRNLLEGQIFRGAFGPTAGYFFGRP